MLKIPTPNEKKLQAIRYAESEALFTSIGDGAISTNENGQITRINSTAKKILSINENVIGEHLHKVIKTFDNSGNEIPLEERLYAKVIKEKKAISVRRRVRRNRKTDPFVDVSGTVSPIMHKNKAIGVIIIFHDISDYIKIEEMKNDFISLASHQLRTPLSSISTYSHMLADGFVGNMTEDQIKIVKTIIKSSNRMNGVISSLMNISKIENGAVKFAPKKTNITQLLDGVFHENRVALEEKNIAYRNLSDKENPCIITNDSILLVEIINNLVSNAIKYTPKNGEVITKVIRTEIGATIEIIDNGIGIDEADQDKIFEKFFRAPGATKQETFGSGLGLYIVKGFLDIIGGSVRYKTKIGEGTTFELNIPDFSVKHHSV